MSIIINKPCSWYSSVTIIFMTLGFLCQEGLPLSCHRCISIQCNTSPDICVLEKEFMQVEMAKIYYMDGYLLPNCPDPSNIEEWELMTTKLPSKLPCGEFVQGQATCVLGRFQLISRVVDTNINVTTHGTVLGCARKQLLESTSNKSLGKDRKATNSYQSQTGCHSDHSQSEVRNSLQHSVEIEHCPQVSDMCHIESYCIHPQYSDVRTFKREDPYQDSSRSATTFMTTLIWIAIAIGIVVVIMTFAGIKYG